MSEQHTSAGQRRISAVPDSPANTEHSPRTNPPPELWQGIPGFLANATDPYTEGDRIGVVLSLLAYAGALIGPGPCVQIAEDRHRLIVWPLLIGPTAAGRKGTATDVARRLARAAFPAESTELEVTGLSSGEGLVARLSGDDEQRKRVLVYEPEFGTVMARARREGSSLSGILRTAWDRPDLSVLTKVPLTATGTFVVVIGHVTSREFRSRLADSDLAGGTYNRFLPVVVQRSKSLPDGEGLPEQLVASLGQHLKHAVTAARGVGLVARGPAAQRAWRDSMYDEFVEPKGMLDTAAAEFTARAAAYCLRIAALYAALDGLDKISVDHLDAAAALVRYSIQSANSVLGTTHRDPGVATIQAALDAAGRDGCTRTELHRLFAGHLSATRLGALLADVTANGEYERVAPTPGSSAGRPVDRYRRSTPMIRPPTTEV